MSSTIYLDYMSTTPVDPAVAEVMQTCLTLDGDFGNPASNTHAFGYAASARVDLARQQVADLIHADPREIVWTSGATEAINLALKGSARFYQRQGKHIITMSTEHKAVLDTCAYLSSIGFEMTYLDPKPSGLLDLNELKKAIRSDTILASIMHVNNETGVVQDIQAIGEILKENGVLFHVDAAQSVGKLSIDVSECRVDLMSLVSHKIYGPKGVGALYVRRKPRVQLISQIHGGDHEGGYRSGTLPTHQIVGMGAAYALAKKNRETETARITALRDQLWEGIVGLGGIHLNGDETHRVCGCLNFSVDGVDGESLIQSLYDLALSTGSACNSANPDPSHVLLALGLSRDEANRSLRVSLGRFTTRDDVQRAIIRICEQVNRLRALSPIWQPTIDQLS